MCLRSCLIALRETKAGFLGIGSHHSCLSTACKVDCIRNLQFEIDHYINELSTAIFKKENIRNRKWWLSAFYSFCIQSFVRQALIILVDSNKEAIPSTGLNARSYLHTAVRLFTAISGNSDPMNQQAVAELSMQLDESEKFLIEQYQVAQLAVYQDRWTKMRLVSSGDYLKRLFEDDEPAGVDPSTDVAGPIESDTAEFIAYPQPYLPKIFNVEAYRRYRSDSDHARREYTKHIVAIGKLHGWESAIYNTMEQKWACIDALWQRNNAITISSILKDYKGSSSGQVSSHKHVKRSLKLDVLFTGNETGSPPDIYASTRRTLNTPNSSRLATDEEIHKEEPRFKDDLYWPRWLRGLYGCTQEGWCGMCQPGRWLSLDGPYQDDKDFNHGICGVTGKLYDEPKDVRCIKALLGTWWGLCGTCDEWIELGSEGGAEKPWFVHAFGVSSTFHPCSAMLTERTVLRMSVLI
jgi:hypothetical protein